ncbi:B12-binding domain-containing radical SAM protein [Desulfovibrio ferrophilus]|uniref:Radical SAM domain protein n=1 Tax=Desulfovibrio ferrophilus TaxID=241368 RepID=A0A2Z6B0M8_9BACT|nr:radical SAM protein [Desulfovibrio ferrophilus]BBD09034.1 radical SAM domain protein [Desulfovibrio ferrophilus]
MPAPKVALIYAYWLEERTHTEDIRSVPIGTYAIAAACIQAGYEVRVFDWHGKRGFEDDMEAELRSFAPDVVGFTVLQANRFGALEIAALAKRVLSDVPVVFGGISATALWDFFLRHYPQLDAVVLGEGDVTMPELVAALCAGDDLASVAGIAYRGPQGPCCSAVRPPVKNLDDLPIPARWFRYNHLALTRGCPGRCTFCGSPDFWGPRVRFRSAKHFVDEMQLLVEQGIDNLYVSDDTFTLDKGRVIEVCREILDRGLDVQWQAISRVNAVDAEVLGWMRRAGCIQISFGVESGDTEIRDFLNKNIREEDVVRAFALSHSVGILARAYFIYGCPGESEATVDRTLALIDRIRPLVCHFFILSIFPGTALYERYKQQTGATDDIWLERIEDIKYFQTDETLDLETVERFGNRLRSEYGVRLPEYAARVELSGDPELAVRHADFLARLGMTFHDGDYSSNPLVNDPLSVAEVLYRRALDYHPDATAALGLGLILQKRREYPESVRALALGLTANEGHPKLCMALAVSLMNLGEFGKALSFLLPFEDNPQALQYAALCFRNMGEREHESRTLERLRGLQKG